MRLAKERMSASALDEALARFRGRTQPTINILLQAGTCSRLERQIVESLRERWERGAITPKGSIQFGDSETAASLWELRGGLDAPFKPIRSSEVGLTEPVK